MIRFEPTRNWSTIEWGKRAMMPIKMMSEIPFPIPRSVICSPSHIMNIVPAVRNRTVLIVKANPWISKGTIGCPSSVRLVSRTLTPHPCRAATTTVPYRVSWFSFFRPSSPSFESFWKYGTTAPRSWRMIEELMYGMIPSAKIAAFLNAPPTNRSYSPNSVLAAWLASARARRGASTPGSVTWAPIRTTIRSAAVNISRVRSSCIFRTLRMLSAILAIRLRS